MAMVFSPELAMSWKTSGEMNPALGLMAFVVLDDFLDDEGQEFLGEFRVEIGLFRKIGEPGDLGLFADRVGRGKTVFCLEAANTLGVLEPFGQGEDQYRIEPVDGFPVFFQ
jgi:hypothetical protein